MPATVSPQHASSTDTWTAKPSCARPRTALKGGGPAERPPRAALVAHAHDARQLCRRAPPPTLASHVMHARRHLPPQHAGKSVLVASDRQALGPDPGIGNVLCEWPRPSGTPGSGPSRLTSRRSPPRSPPPRPVLVDDPAGTSSWMSCRPRFEVGRPARGALSLSGALNQELSDGFFQFSCFQDP